MVSTAVVLAKEFTVKISSTVDALTGALTGAIIGVVPGIGVDGLSDVYVSGLATVMTAFEFVLPDESMLCC